MCEKYSVIKDVRPDVVTSVAGVRGSRTQLA